MTVNFSDDSESNFSAEEKQRIVEIEKELKQKTQSFTITHPISKETFAFSSSSAILDALGFDSYKKAVDVLISEASIGTDTLDQALLNLYLMQGYSQEEYDSDKTTPTFAQFVANIIDVEITGTYVHSLATDDVEIGIG